MHEIGAAEAKDTLDTSLDRVEVSEEDCLVTSFDQDQARAACDRIRERAKALQPGAFDWETLKADRDEGRP